MNGSRKELIDAELDRRTVQIAGSPDRLTEAVRYSLLAPGKRLRPIFVLLAAELTGGNPENALPAACAVEMVHSYSLIHDDLPAMDDDDLRRGRPTCHKQFDEAAAILAGDALLTLAFETIGSMEPKSLAGECALLLAKAAGPSGMVGGQADDVFFAASDEKTQERLKSQALLEAIHRRKTSAMIGISLDLGAVVGGAAKEERTALARYGEAFGLAFQITDDLLDVLGDEAAVGKRLRKDSDSGKLTFPAFFGIDGSRQEGIRQVELARKSLEIFPDSEPRQILDRLAASLPDRIR